MWLMPRDAAGEAELRRAEQPWSELKDFPVAIQEALLRSSKTFLDLWGPFTLKSPILSQSCQSGCLDPFPVSWRVFRDQEEKCVKFNSTKAELSNNIALEA
jgi:hypothetical protein